MNSYTSGFILKVNYKPTNSFTNEELLSATNSPCEDTRFPLHQRIAQFNDFNNVYIIDPLKIAAYKSYENNVKEYKRKRSNKSKFTSEEDKHLLILVSKYGDRNWKKIAGEMEGRSVRQCRDRYRHYLSPNINQKEWSEEEDRLLMEKVGNIGCKWKKMEKFFENRNEIQIRNRYYQITHHNSSENKIVSKNGNFLKYDCDLKNENSDSYNEDEFFENEVDFQTDNFCFSI